MNEPTKPKLTTVRDLLPSFFEPQGASEVNAGILRQAFRAHIMFFLEAGMGLQPRTIAQSNVQDRENLIRLLAEPYSRAIMECAFAQYFDGTNPQSYVPLRAEIGELFGQSIMLAVHDLVRERGVVLDELASPSAPTQPAPPVAVAAQTSVAEDAEPSSRESQPPDREPD